VKLSEVKLSEVRLSKIFYMYSHLYIDILHRSFQIVHIFDELAEVIFLSSMETHRWRI